MGKRFLGCPYLRRPIHSLVEVITVLFQADALGHCYIALRSLIVVLICLLINQLRSPLITLSFVVVGVISLLFALFLFCLKLTRRHRRPKS